MVSSFLQIIPEHEEDINLKKSQILKGFNSNEKKVSENNRYSDKKYKNNNYLTNCFEA